MQCLHFCVFPWLYECGVICLSSTFIPNGKIILTEKIYAVLQLYSINLKVILNNFYFVTVYLYVVWNSVGDVSGLVIFLRFHMCVALFLLSPLTRRVGAFQILQKTFVTYHFCIHTDFLLPVGAGTSDDTERERLYKILSCKSFNPFWVP